MKNNLKKSFTNYLHDTLAIEVKHLGDAATNKLPFFLTDKYHLFNVEFVGRKFILLLNRTEETETPATLNKHINIIRKQLRGDVIYIAAEIVPYERKRLIGYKIPFVVPRTQMYMPDLMIDLREHFRSKRGKKKILSPAGQALLIYLLNERTLGPFTPTMLAYHMHYSNMTMTRAFNELEDIGVFNESKSGKERSVTIDKSFSEIWNMCLPFLRSPIKRVIYVKINESVRKDKLKIAGITALSEYTMIASPELREYALSMNDFNEAIENKTIQLFEYPEDADAKLEIWRYSTRFNFENEHIVDKYSLYLSLKDDEDDRIQIALDELTGKIKW